MFLILFHQFFPVLLDLISKGILQQLLWTSDIKSSDTYRSVQIHKVSSCLNSLLTAQTEIVREATALSRLAGKLGPESRAENKQLIPLAVFKIFGRIIRMLKRGK